MSTTEEKYTKLSFAHHTGTTKYVKFNALCPESVATDGVMDIADKLHAYWLLDAVGSYQHEIMLGLHGRRLAEMQFWKLEIDEDGDGATLNCYEDSGEPAAITQRIEYTDIKTYFDGNEIEIWVGVAGVQKDNKSYNVLHLPSEH